MAETVPGHSFTLKQSTAFVRTFFFGTSGDTVTVNISKAGGGGIPGAFGAPSGGATATAIASGWYYIGLSGTDTNGAGVLAYHCSGAPSGNTCDFADLIQTTIFSDLMIDGTGRVFVTSNLKQGVIGTVLFFMTLQGSSNPAPGVSVTGQRTFGAPGFGSITGTILEVGGVGLGAGWYVLNASAADLNAACVGFKMTAVGCNDTDFTIWTQP